MSPTNPCDVSLNYFSATLGQAAQRPRTAFTTVNELIDRQAQKHRDRFACGFPTPHPAQGGTSSIISTYAHDRLLWLLTHNFSAFGQLYHASLLAAAEFELLLSNQGRKKHSQCVALLCPSSNAFLWTWLGLMRAGCAVLLIAQVPLFPHITTWTNRHHVAPNANLEQLLICASPAMPLYWSMMIPFRILHPPHKPVQINYESVRFLGRILQSISSIAYSGWGF